MLSRIPGLSFQVGCKWEKKKTSQPKSNQIKINKKNCKKVSLLEREVVGISHWETDMIFVKMFTLADFLPVIFYLRKMHRGIQAYIEYSYMLTLLQDLLHQGYSIDANNLNIINVKYSKV